MKEPKPNMANTPKEMEAMVQEALGRLTLVRAEIRYYPTPLERFIGDVMEGVI